MRKNLLSFAAAAVFAGALAAAPASATTIDFDAFSDAQNINGLNLGGVTLTAAGGAINIFSNGRFGASFNSPFNSFSTPNGQGTISGVFDAATNFVSLFAGDSGGDIDSWKLEAFDAVAGGNSLGVMLSGDYTGDPYLQLAVFSANIWRFEATWTGTAAGIAYDDLSFQGRGGAVPEPGALALLGLGLAGLAAIRRRRQ